jgi:tripartite-type tricarboxylate transporter receptor subunit TctC
LVTAGVLLSSAALAEDVKDYPSRAVTLIVPYPAGGGFDFYSRAIGERLEKALGERVIVENKPGASTQLAAELVANAEPDGYTVLVAGASMVTTAPHLYKKLAYSPDQFQPVTNVLEQPMALWVNPKSEPDIKTLEDYVNYVKKNPGKLFYADTGRGITTHLIGETLSIAAGIDITAVHYKGSSPARQDFLAGAVPFFVDGIPANLPHYEAGTMIPLAVTTQQRISALPDAPTFGEAGYPQAGLSSWLGLMVPAGTPMDIVQKLHEGVVTAMEDEALRERSASEGAVPILEGPEAFAARIAREYDQWGKIIDQIGLKLD